MELARKLLPILMKVSCDCSVNTVVFTINNRTNGRWENGGCVISSTGVATHILTLAACQKLCYIDTNHNFHIYCFVGQGFARNWLSVKTVLAATLDLFAFRTFCD